MAYENSKLANINLTRKYTFVSYPKSGRTWLKTIMAFNYHCYKNKVPTNELTGRMIYDIGRRYDAYFTHLNTNAMGSIGEIAEYIDKFYDNNKTIIFLSRNPLDTICSYYYELNYRHSIDVYGHISLDKTIKSRFEKLIQFNLFWNKTIKLKGGLHIRYEGIDRETIIKLFAFIRRPITGKKSTQLMRLSSFHRMKDKEKRGQFDDHCSFKPPNKKNEDTYKVRRGVIGGYFDILNDDQISYCNKIMEKYNYEQNIS